MSWIIFLQFIPYFLVCKKVFIWKLQPPLLLSLFCGYLLAQRMCRWCSSSSSFHPHAHPFPVPVTASALQLRQRIRVSFFFFGCPFQLRNHLRPSVAGVGCGGWSRGQGDYTACLLLGQRQKISARVCIEFKRRFIIYSAPPLIPPSLCSVFSLLFLLVHIYFF